MLVGPDLPSARGGGGELKQGPIPTSKQSSESEENHLRLRVWHPKWNKNQTVLAKAIHTPDRDAGPLEGKVAGSWSLGIVELSQGKGCC